MKTFINILILSFICFIGMSQSSMIFTYDMSQGDTIIEPYSVYKYIDNPYVLDISYPDTDSVFYITVLRKDFWNDTLYYNSNQRFYPFEILPEQHKYKSISINCDKNYVTYVPAIFIDATEGDNSVITIIWKIRSR